MRINTHFDTMGWSERQNKPRNNTSSANGAKAQIYINQAIFPCWPDSKTAVTAPWAWCSIENNDRLYTHKLETATLRTAIQTDSPTIRSMLFSHWSRAKPSLPKPQRDRQNAVITSTAIDNAISKCLIRHLTTQNENPAEPSRGTERPLTIWLCLQGLASRDPKHRHSIRKSEWSQRMPLILNQESFACHVKWIQVSGINRDDLLIIVENNAKDAEAGHRHANNTTMAEHWPLARSVQCLCRCFPTKHNPEHGAEPMP